MRKILTTLIAVAAIGATALATASTADARWGYGWRGGWGWGPGPFIGGAIVGGALAAGAYGAYGYPTTTLRLLPLPLRSVSLLRARLPPRLERLCLGPRLLLKQAAGFTAKIVPPVAGGRLNFACAYDFSHQTSAK